MYINSNSMNCVCNVDKNFKYHLSKKLDLEHLIQELISGYKTFIMLPIHNWASLVICHALFSCFERKWNTALQSVTASCPRLKPGLEERGCPCFIFSFLVKQFCGKIKTNKEPMLQTSTVCNVCVQRLVNFIPLCLWAPMLSKNNWKHINETQCCTHMLLFILTHAHTHRPAAQNNQECGKCG